MVDISKRATSRAAARYYILKTTIWPIPMCKASKDTNMITILLSLIFLIPNPIVASPLQLASPVLIGTSLNNSTSLTILNSTVLQTNSAKCFGAQDVDLPVKNRHCKSAAMQLNYDHHTRPYIFSRSPEAQYRLPRFFQSDECAMYLDMISEDDFDTMTLPDIEAVADSLISQCVVAGHAYQFGGLATVGPKHLLHVMFYGREVLPMNTS